MSERRLRPRPAWLRALGRNDPPVAVTVAGECYRWRETFKHDSWAATALYTGPRGTLVIKFNREQPLFFLPMKWLGRRLARRETRALRILHDVIGVPRSAGEVETGGAARDTAVAHDYIEGRPLHMDDQPGPGFFAELERLLSAIHQRGMAYVDLNKRENILVQLDDTPALLDFQLHFTPSPTVLRLPFVRAALRQLQAADKYHLQKHVAWHSAGPNVAVPEPPLSSRMWRAIYVRPMQFFRRRLLVWLGVRDSSGRATGELEPEQAARLSLERRASNPSARLPGE